MKKKLILRAARPGPGSGFRDVGIVVLPCDRGIAAEQKALLAATVRLMRGQYTWSIPVRMFGSISRAGG